MDSLESLVVGENGCTFNEIVNVFFYDVNSAAVFQNWKDLARQLEIQPYLIEQWNRDILIRTLTAKDVLHNILESWKTKKGKDATLPDLLKHLKRVNLKNVADDLTSFFSIENRVHEVGPIFKRTLPTKSNYYIARTLITRRVIEKKVFSSTPTDIFVLHGIDRYGLSQLAGKELTDTSVSQVRKPQLSVRFILLRHFRDWDLLCERTSNPIHLLRHRDGKFLWTCTKGDVSALQQASDEINQNQLIEEEFILEMESEPKFQTNQPICISDSPGMGKSLLLASIGIELQQRYPDRIIAFIVIAEFVVKIMELLPKFGNKEDALVEALLQTLCENNSAREQLVQKIRPQTDNPSTQVEVMFDGLDEVSTENFQLAHECLEILKTNFNKTTRVWVTTRPQHLLDLEKCFSVLGYNIQAFQENHQIDFLTSYWNIEQENMDKDKLKAFSKNCLSILNKQLNKNDEDIAGIPLQCMMIADVYSQEAYGFCDANNEILDNYTESASCIDVNSIADLHEKIIEYKIEKFIRTFHPKPDVVRNIWPFHMYLGLESIFPSDAHKFKDALQIGQELENDDLVNIGILEHRGSNKQDPARFVHGTFAEYLAARYFISNVIGHSMTGLQNSSTRLPNFLFKDVLECSVKKCLSHLASSTYYQCSFKHPILCHFLDALLGSRTNISNENSISEESSNYIKDVVYACIHYGFGNIVKFLCGLKYPQSFCVKKMLYFDSEILIDATTMASLELLKFLLQTFEHKPLTTVEGKAPKPNTVLHAAVRRGSYSIFEYILKEHDFGDLVRKDRRFLDLVRSVEDTYNVDHIDIEDRVQIQTALCDLNRAMVNYCDFNFNITPLLGRRVNTIY